MALAAIHRPGALTASIVLSLGLGLAALVALSLIDFNMRNELHQTLPGVTPNFFFLDLRSTEAPRFLDFLKAEAPGAKISETPMMRGRFVSSRARRSLRSRRATRSPGRWKATAASPSPRPAGGIRSHKGKVVGGGLCGAAARIDGEGGGEGPRPEDRRSRSSSTCSVATSQRRSPTCARSTGAASRSISCSSIRRIRSRARLSASSSRQRCRRVTDPTRKSRFCALRRMTSRRSRPCGCTTRSKRVEGLIDKLALAIRAATGVALLTSVLVLAGAFAANRRARLADATI